MDPDHVTRAILGIANFHIQNRVVGLVAPVGDDDRVIEPVIDLLLHGIELPGR